MSESATAHYSGVPYAGTVSIQTLVDSTYEWKVDNKRFTFQDYSSITEEEIPNPYYREGINSAVANASIIVLPVKSSKTPVNGYRIWNVTPPDQIPGGNKLTVPYAVNYCGIDLLKRLNPKTWFIHGLVVQVIYYENYDKDTDTYSNPMVRERWDWDLDPETNFANSRTITIGWYEDQADNILPPEKVYQKYYNTAAEKVTEIQRRRRNVINTLMEQVMGMIAYTEGMSIGDAIIAGQLFLSQVNSLINDFIEHGDDDLAYTIMSPDLVATHPWLDNDLAIFGSPGVTINQMMYAELLTDISDALDAFSFDSLPES